MCTLYKITQATFNEKPLFGRKCKDGFVWIQGSCHADFQRMWNSRSKSLGRTKTNIDFQ